MDNLWIVGFSLASVQVFLVRCRYSGIRIRAQRRARPVNPPIGVSPMARSRASVSVASVPSANPPEVIDPASTPPASPALATVIPGGTGEALSATPALKDALGTLGASGKLDGLKVPTPAEWRSAVRARVGFELSSKDRKDLGIRDCTAQDTLILSIVQVLDALGADMSAYQYSRTRADGTTSTVNARSINPSLVAKVTRATEMRSIAAAAR